MDHELKLLAGNSNVPLGQNVSQHLGVKLTPALISRFNNGEIQVQVQESVRDAHCFIVQSISASQFRGKPTSVNDNLMELLVLTDALVRAGAYRIVAVTPHYGYARQDKKTKPREPITASLVARLMEETGIQRLMAFDFHNPSIQGFFKIPVDNLTGDIALCNQLVIDGWSGDDVVVASTDFGGVGRADRSRVRLGVKRAVAIIEKHRSEPGKAEAVRLIGRVHGKRTVVFDDMFDTCGSIVAAAGLLKQRGATQVCVAATHPIFSGPAIERLFTCQEIDQVYTTDTIQLPASVKRVSKRYQRPGLIRVASIAKILAEAIRCNYNGGSLHELFA
ncbi:ribose-phosphate diphosphokinase [Patescibacteria group bacterium]|nr:ribose-phosphate diphosphokinase [Patescibacteria group bacterium]